MKQRPRKRRPARHSTLALRALDAWREGAFDRARETARVAVAEDAFDALAHALLARLALADAALAEARAAVLALRAACGERPTGADYSVAALELRTRLLGADADSDDASSAAFSVAPEGTASVEGEGVEDWLAAAQDALDGGHFELAARLFAYVLDAPRVLDGARAAAALGLSQSRRLDADDDPAFRSVKKLVARLDAAPAERLARADAYFALGRANDDRGDYAGAAKAWLEANALADAGASAKRHTALADALVEVADAALFERRGGVGCDDARPLFIVGMPRSGTTLVEQILAAHSEVFAAGETPALGRLVGALERRAGTRYPGALAALPAGAFASLGQAYVDALAIPDSAACVTDKLPSNFMLLGLVALVLPRARVLHVTRSPLDTGVSLFSTRFLNGHEWAQSFAGIAAYQRAHDRAMAHWRAVLPLRIREVRYEALVADFEAGARAIIDFAGLDFEPACLAAHRASRRVATASNWQVRQPVYRSAVGRFARYAPYLDGLAQALRDAGVPIGETHGIES